MPIAPNIDMVIAVLRGKPGIVTPPAVDNQMVVNPRQMYMNQQLDEAEKNEFGPGIPVSITGR